MRFIHIVNILRFTFCLPSCPSYEKERFPLACVMQARSEIAVQAREERKRLKSEQRLSCFFSSLFFFRLLGTVHAVLF